MKLARSRAPKRLTAQSGGYLERMAVFKLGSPTIARCGVCGGSVFSDAHVVRHGGRVNHAECVLYPKRRAARPPRSSAPPVTA